MTRNQILMALTTALFLLSPFIVAIISSIHSPEESKKFISNCDTMHGVVGQVDHKMACVDVIFYRVENL